MSKFHHQASFCNWKVAKLCINEFPNQNSWKEYSHPKRANAKSFAYKRGLVVWYFLQHLLEFGKEVRHLPAGFYLGYLRGGSFPPKNAQLLPPHQKKYCYHYSTDISNYIGKIIWTRRGQCTHCNISRNCVSKCTWLRLSVYSFQNISGRACSRTRRGSSSPSATRDFSPKR